MKPKFIDPGRPAKEEHESDRFNCQVLAYRLAIRRANSNLSIMLKCFDWEISRKPPCTKKLSSNRRPWMVFEGSDSRTYSVARLPRKIPRFTSLWNGLTCSGYVHEPHSFVCVFSSMRSDSMEPRKSYSQIHTSIYLVD